MIKVTMENVIKEGIITEEIVLVDRTLKLNFVFENNSELVENLTATIISQHDMRPTATVEFKKGVEMRHLDFERLNEYNSQLSDGLRNSIIKRLIKQEEEQFAEIIAEMNTRLEKLINDSFESMKL